ncbi:MAG: winged helix-turn-helix domain-containing protein [Acidobacteriota bacterium]
MDASNREIADNDKGIYEFSGYRLDVSERLLLRGTDRIQIPDKPFEVLCVLAARSGSLVGKDELISKVWGKTVVEENNLDKSVSLLRNILGERKSKEKFIETVRGHGYRFVAETTRVTSAPSTDTGKNLSDPSRFPRPATRSASRGARSMTNVVELAEWHSAEPQDAPTVAGSSAEPKLVAVADGRFHAENPHTVPSALDLEGKKSLIFLVGAFVVAAAVVTFYFGFFASRKGPTSVAVLPFLNTTQDPSGDYLSDGLTESIINSLSLRSGLKVMSRNSAFRFRDDQSNTRHVASQLGVESILTGDIKPIGDKLVVIVHLIDPSDDSQIWGNQYVRTSGDVISLQNDIARDISRRLGAQRSGAEEKTLTKQYTDNPDAYKAYLKGRYHFEKFSPQDARKALEYFQEAVMLDPNFAAAYAHLAAVYVSDSGAHEVPRRETILKARESALKAVSLDDQLPMAHEVYGFILFNFDYNFDAAERELKKALELDPNDASARETYGGLLASLGRHDESLTEVQRAAELNPLSPSIGGSVGNSLLSARRYDDAIVQYKKALELDAYFIQTHRGLAIAYQMTRNYAASVEERARITEIMGNPQGAAFMRESFARGGWQGFLREMTENSRAPQPSPYINATLYAELGEKDKAFSILNRLYEDDSSSVVKINSDPRFDKLRGDPRFTDLLKRMNFE